jgi:hypothetical protein
MKRKLVKKLLPTAALILFLVSSCTEYKEPALIFDPNEVNPIGSPVITSVMPAGSAIAGVREITILGGNFTSGDTTWVFIGSQSPIIKSISNTEIVAYRPPNYGNALDIKVVVPSAEAVGRLGDYNLEIPIAELPIFNSPPRFFVMEVDKYGACWVAGPRRIDKISSDGLFATVFMDRTMFNSRFVSFTDMKFGAGGFLYLALGLRTEIFRIDPRDSTRAPETYVVLPNATAKLDFDASGNIYTGGGDGIYVVDANRTITATGHYGGKTITEIRVFNGYLYVSDAKNVWKSVIGAGGSLGPDELVVNLNDLPSLSGCTISSFNIDVAGTVYLALRNHPQYTVFVVESEASVTPFYVDNIIPSLVDQLVWGHDSRYLYLNRSNSLIGAGSRVYRMGMERNGAPNLGRDL